MSMNDELYFHQQSSLFGDHYNIEIKMNTVFLKTLNGQLKIGEWVSEINPQMISIA